MIRTLAAGLALLALAACGSGQDAAEENAQEAEAELEAQLTPAADETAQADEETPVEVTIPKSIQGRWGLVEADCTSTAGDAKGLLTITPTRLEFYESVGKLTDVTELAPNHLRALFSFTGEGLEWQREQVLNASEDGKTLTRREMGDGAAPKPFRYIQCSKAEVTSEGGDSGES